MRKLLSSNKLFSSKKTIHVRTNLSLSYLILDTIKYDEKTRIVSCNNPAAQLEFIKNIITSEIDEIGTALLKVKKELILFYHKKTFFDSHPFKN